MEEILAENSTDVLVAHKPQIGMVFSSEEEAYAFYNRYGGNLGVSIRRAYAYKKKDNRSIILGRTFVCSKEGCRGNDKKDDTINSRAETRTNCPANMRISRTANGEYKCRSFVEEHNHDLATPDTIHFLQSQRSIMNSDAVQIDLADKSGMKPKAVFDYLGMEVGGRDKLGYTKLDLKNYLQTKRQRNLEYGEGGWLTNYFETQSRINPTFTWNMQYDMEEEITNIFWADPRMIVDYELFGDVVSFDTTFCTNKDYWPLGIFAGFNHHKGVVIFGAALLYDETIASFKWSFERFLEAHGQKKPITIFTDQDSAMANAISEVFTGTVHGLCTWHLMQNAIKNVGNLLKEGSSFMKNLTACVYEYTDVGDFETAWKKLLDDYPSDKRSWLDRIYAIKEKWARCYMKETVTLGLKSTQLSESFNADLKDYLKCTYDLPIFFHHFERVLEAKRANELKAEFDARNKLPKNMGSKALILRQAGKMYTPYAYKMFLEEYNWKDNCFLKSRFDNDILCQYVVGRIDEEGAAEDGEYDVQYQPSVNCVTCTCRKFEGFGILCCHILKIYDLLDIKCIPEAYILRRWRRDARMLVVDTSKGNQEMEDARLDYTKRWRFLWPKYLRILTQACNSVEGFELANNAADALGKKVGELGIVGPILKASSQCNVVNKVSKLKRKERIQGRRRHKSWVDKLCKKKKCYNAPTTPLAKEMISAFPSGSEMMSTSLSGFEDSPCQPNHLSRVMTIGSSQASTSTPALSQQQPNFYLVKILPSSEAASL